MRVAKSRSKFPTKLLFPHGSFSGKVDMDRCHRSDFRAGNLPLCHQRGMAQIPMVRAMEEPTKHSTRVYSGCHSCNDEHLPLAIITLGLFSYGSKKGPPENTFLWTGDRI